MIFFSVVWYACPIFYGGNLIAYERALFFYAMGGFIRLYGAPIKNKMLQVLLVGVTWGVGTGIWYLMSELSIGRGDNSKIKIEIQILQVIFSTIVVPICASGLFRMFEGLKIGYKKYINLFASTTFGIYLIHESQVGRHFIWYDLFKVDIMFVNDGLFPILMVPIIVAVFFACSVIDLIRIFIFEQKEMKFGKKVLEKFEKLCINDKGK